MRVVAFEGNSCPVRGIGRRVLLDFDGLVLRNAKIHGVVERRSAEWIAERLHTDDMRLAETVNRDTFRKFGHSALYEGNPVVSHTLVDSYNNYVFDDELLYDIVPEMTTVEDVIRTQRIWDVGRERGLEFVLCANPPLRYVERVLSAQGLCLDTMFPHARFTSDGLGTVKPRFEFFHEVERRMGPTTSPPHFLDDSAQNVRCASLMGWNAIEMSDLSDIIDHLRTYTIDPYA